MKQTITELRKRKKKLESEIKLIDKHIDTKKSNVNRIRLPKKYLKLIESLEEKMMNSWNSQHIGFGGLGNSMRIQGRAYYDGDKRKILAKTKWDDDCEKFIKKMMKEINKGA